MGFFDHLQKKGSKAIKPEPPQIRKEIETLPATRKVLVPQRSRSNTPVNRNLKVAKPLKLADRARLSPAPKVRKRANSEQPPLESDSDDDGSDPNLDQHGKRVKLDEDVYYDASRQICCQSAFLDEDAGTPPMVHASSIASPSMPAKYKLAFPMDAESSAISVQYPSASGGEKYQLVVPIQSDDFKPLEDIREAIGVITEFYLSADDKTILKDDSHGLLRRLRRAVDKGAGIDYAKLILEWNETIIKLRRNGDIIRIIKNVECLDLRLIERILTQTYSRIVSPRVGLLRQYENGTDNVYGELLPKFISDILRKDTKLKSNSVFVDLGSGVGNVVLQAALEVGCESWGCEMMENACDLAELQEREFKARCWLWGLTVGDIHLERGDFLENATIGKVLQKADVVLINNQAFTPELNDRLTSHFLDLKEGCKVVSLKSFVPSGHKITSRNLNSAYNVLEVVEKRYYSACVSWTDAPGSYFVSTKDSSKLKAFAQKNPK